MQDIQASVEEIGKNATNSKCKMRVSLTKSISKTSLGEDISKYSTINPTDRVHRKNKALFVRKSSMVKNRDARPKLMPRKNSELTIRKKPNLGKNRTNDRKS